MVAETLTAFLRHLGEHREPVDQNVAVIRNGRRVGKLVAGGEQVSISYRLTVMRGVDATR